MVRDNCKVCLITLSDYEKEEYEELCLECNRELHDLPKSQKTTVNVRLKNKKYFARSIQN
jgi:hypothetical protein